MALCTWTLELLERLSLISFGTSILLQQNSKLGLSCMAYHLIHCILFSLKPLLVRLSAKQHYIPPQLQVNLGWMPTLGNGCSHHLPTHLTNSVMPWRPATDVSLVPTLMRVHALVAYTACRLIPLDKHPGVRPIGIGEVM